MQVTEPEARQGTRRAAERLHGVRVAHIVEGTGRGEPDTHPTLTPDPDDRLSDLPEKANAVHERAAVAVAPVIRGVAQELIDQVAVRSMDLDAVEPGLFSAPGSVGELRHDPRDFMRLERPRRDEGRPAPGRDSLPRRLDGRGRDRQRPAGLHGGVRDAPHVPQLQHDPPTRRVDRADNVLPPGDLLVGVDAGRVRIPQAFGRDLRGFGHDESGGRSLPVVRSHQGSRHIARAGTVAGHGCHHHTVRQPQHTHRGGGEQQPGNCGDPSIESGLQITPPPASVQLMSYRTYARRATCHRARRGQRTARERSSYERCFAIVPNVNFTLEVA